MIYKEALNNLIDEFNQEGRTKTFAEFIAALFKDKLIEIYLGDSFEEVSTEQTSSSYPAVFCGQVLGAYKECLVINGVSTSKASQPKLGNMVLVNERAIRGLTVMDGHGTMEQMFIKSGGTEAEHVRKKFGNEPIK